MSSVPCPDCGAAMPVHDGYVTWCDRCDHGILAPSQEPPNTVFDRIHQSLGKRFGDQLLADMLRTPNPKPGLSTDLIPAYVIAGVVNLIPLLVVGAAISFAINQFQAWNDGTPISAVLCFGVPVLALLLGLAWQMRPRLGKAAEKPLKREAAPELYALADQIADAMKTRRPASITLTPYFNASYSEVGLFRRVQLEIGWPMILADTPQELVAEISHELAHGVNGDINRNWFMHTALNTLYTLHFVTAPDGNNNRGLIALFYYLFLFPISMLIRLIAEAMLFLTFRASQRSEFYADLLGARISGSGAALSALRKSEMGGHFMHIAQTTWARLKIFKNESVYDKFRVYVQGMPQRELERFARMQARSNSRLDSTHPPTEHRVQFLKAQGPLASQITLSDDRYAAIVRQLQPLERDLQAQMMGE